MTSRYIFRYELYFIDKITCEDVLSVNHGGWPW